jgi:hypothetical protein
VSGFFNGLLGEAERATFATERARFAKAIIRLARDPLLEGELTDWEGEIPDIISELKVLRGLAQASVAAAETPQRDTTDVETADLETCVSVVVSIFPASHSGDETLMLVSCERERVHFWARQNRSRLWYRAARLIAAQALAETNETLSENIDAVVAESEG